MPTPTMVRLPATVSFFVLMAPMPPPKLSKWEETLCPVITPVAPAASVSGTDTSPPLQVRLLVTVRVLAAAPSR